MSPNRKCRVALPVLTLSLFLWTCGAQTANAADWVKSFQPIDPEELKMTSEPSAPGAPAIILYRNVYRDDSSGHSARTAHEDNYIRIKILTEEGRKQADVEIEFDKDLETFVNLHARTIKPDGTAVEFDGKTFNKTIVKAHGFKYLAKTFTLPAVEVGCVIEYYYTFDLSERWIVRSNWILSHELFTKAADFSLKPYTSDYAPVSLRWSWQNMPPGSSAVKQDPMGIVRAHVTNVAAFPTEDMMPPENELKARVDFSYTLDDPDTVPSRYWSRVGKRINGHVDDYVGRPKSVQQAVDATVGPNDPPEVKLQKIYARVQKIRNTTFEVRKTEQEEKRAKEKDQTNAGDVWKRGYGDRDDITLLFLAMVKAAGFEASGMVLADRENYFFDPNRMQGDRLDAFLVTVNVNGATLFFDPGSAYTPYGMLPWWKTGVQGLQLNKKEPVWVTTWVPAPDHARTERRANLTLTDTGDLEGKLTVTFSGLEGARYRVDERNADDTERKKFLEDEVKGYVPAACELKLTNQPDWKSTESALVAEFDLKVPGWASAAGKHLLVAAGILSGRESKLFDHADRIYPIYTEYPYMEADDINIQLPAGWHVATLPSGWKDSGKVVTYNLAAANNNGKVHLTRTLAVNFILLDKKYYGALRHYFQEIKNTDDQQIVLDADTTKAQN